MNLTTALTLGIGICTILMIILIIILFCVVQGQTRDFLTATREREQALKALLTARRQTKTVPEGVKIIVMPGREIGYAFRNNSPNSESFLNEERRQMLVTPASDFPPVLYQTNLIDIESMENYSVMDRYSVQSYSQARSNTPAASETSVQTPNSEPANLQQQSAASSSSQLQLQLQQQQQQQQLQPYVGSPPGSNSVFYYAMQEGGKKVHKAKSDRM